MLVQLCTSSLSQLRASNTLPATACAAPFDSWVMIFFFSSSFPALCLGFLLPFWLATMVERQLSRQLAVHGVVGVLVRRELFTWGSVWVWRRFGTDA